MIHVKIIGEIKNPGIYELPIGSQVKDLIEVSGGLTEKASLESISPDSELAEGQIVKIGVNK
jgi:competence protein ComEA